MEGSVSERPTMQQAFAADIAPVTESLPVSTPTSETPAPVIATADATVPPDATSPTPVIPSTEATGPIPLERHKSILDGAYKERDEARQQLEAWKPYEWAKQVDQTALNEAVKLGQLYQNDRAGYIRQVLAEAAADADLAPLVRSEAARVLGARPAKPAEPLDLSPDIPVFDQAGQQVSTTYSADRVKQLLQQQRTEFESLVQPLKQAEDTRAKTAKEAAFAQQQDAFVVAESTRIKTSIQKLPGATEHWKAIQDKARTYGEDVPVGEALRDAYIEVVMAHSSAKAKADVLDTLKTKAAASSVNPAGAVVASTHKPKSMLDPSLKWA